jgi:hypothetical protein
LNFEGESISCSVAAFLNHEWIIKLVWRKSIIREFVVTIEELNQHKWCSVRSLAILRDHSVDVTLSSEVKIA